MITNIYTSPRPDGGRAISVTLTTTIEDMDTIERLCNKLQQVNAQVIKDFEKAEASARALGILTPPPPADS